MRIPGAWPVALSSPELSPKSSESDELRRYRTLFDMAPDAIFLTEDGAVRSVNLAGLRLLGMQDVGEIVGQPVEALLWIDGEASPPEWFAELIHAPGSSPWRETPLRNASGRRVPLEMRVVSYRDGDRLIAQIFCRQGGVSRGRSEERDYAEAILASIPGTFYHFDEQLRLLRWNRNLETISGYSADELAKMGPLDFFPEEYRPDITKALAEMFDKGEAQVEAEVVAKDQRRIPFLVTATRFEYRGRPQFVGVGIDITERWAAEAEWRDSLDRFHAVARATGDVVWDWDLITGRLWWNDNFEEQYGYLADEITIEGWTSRLHPDDRDRVVAGIHASIDGDRDAWSDEYRFLLKNGEYADIFDRGHVLRDASGHAVRMVGTMQDTTHRRRSEYALKEKSTLLEAVVESAGTGILVVGPDGQKLVHNHMLYELLRIPPEIARDERVAPQFEFAVTQAKDPGAWITMATSLIDRQEAIERLEIELIDGRLIDVYTGPVRDTDGRRYGRAWIFKDVTEERRHERKRRQLDRAEAIGNFAAGIAHDLSNMLVPIILSAEQIARGGDRPQEKARIILSAADQAKSLTQEILDFAGERHPAHEPLDIRVSVAEALNLLDHGLPAGIIVERKFPERPAMVAGNATQVLRLALNLCKNAVQAMDEDRSCARKLIVRIEEGAIDAAFARAHSPLRAGPVVTLTVEDSGPGIDAATLKHIFEPFFSTKGHEGTGLGLALVQNIVAQHEGAITVASTPGIGTTFRIWLPALPAPAVTLSPASSSADRIKHILVVDDRADLARAVAEQLRRFGYSAEAIDDPLVARDRIVMLPGRYDLVITDYHMPGMNGAELAAGVRFACPDLPFVLTSGRVSSLDPDLATTFVAFLPKPFTHQKLRKVCAAILDGRDRRNQ